MVPGRRKAPGTAEKWEKGRLQSPVDVVLERKPAVVGKIKACLRFKARTEGERGSWRPRGARVGRVRGEGWSRGVEAAYSPFSTLRSGGLGVLEEGGSPAPRDRGAAPGLI